MHDKLDKIADDIGAIKIVLTAQSGDIKEHIRRTNILEDAVRPMIQDYTFRTTAAARRSERWKTSGMLAGFLAVVVEILKTMLK
jgi:hypothetical protein